MIETEILEEYLKGTGLTIKEIFDRNALAPISQAITAYHLEQMRVKKSDSLPCVSDLFTADQMQEAWFDGEHSDSSGDQFDINNYR